MQAERHTIKVAWRAYSVWAVLVITWLLLPQAVAQSGEETPRIEEMSLEQLMSLTVTVNRREQAIDDVAGTVQALSGDDLKALGINANFRKLQNAVTGLHISNQEGKLEIYLRGIGNSDSDFASDPSVAVHYNGAYLPRPRGIGPILYDTERVEVKKGPQGTLRGRNATGGTIHVISKQPQLNTFAAEGQLMAGEHEQRQMEGFFNLPVGDTFAIRTAFYAEQHESFMRNAFTGSESDLAGLAGQGIRIREAYLDRITPPRDRDDQAVRVSALWQPDDSWQASLAMDWAEQQGASVPGAFSGRALSAGYEVEDLQDPYHQFFLNQGQMEKDIQGLSGRLRYRFQALDLAYHFSVREYDIAHRNAAREWQLGMVYPGAREEIDAVVLGNEQSNYGNFTQSESSLTRTHELRLIDQNNERVNWSAGVFLMEEDFSAASQDFSHGWWGTCSDRADSVCGWLNGLSGENRNDDSRVESQALYADGTFALTDNFRLLAGVRWTQEEKVANEANANYQLVLAEAALDALGLEGPEDIVMGTQGLELTMAGDRPNDQVPLGNSTATRNYFLNGIAQWGEFDNLDDLIAWDPSQFQAIITSDFDTGEGDGNIRKTYDDDYVDWRLGVERDLRGGTLLYGNVSTGTRSGGINRPLPGANAAADVSWKPEQLLVYEVGAKNRLFWRDWPIRYSAAAFYYDYQDKVLQGLVAVPQACDSDPDGICTTNHVQNQNAANASILGFETDLDWRFGEGMRLQANLAYLDSEYDRGSSVVDPRRPAWLYGVDEPFTVDLAGNRLENTSKWNLFLSLSQTFLLDSSWVNSLDWQLSMLYRSRFFLTPFNNKGYDETNNPIPLREMLVNNNSLITDAGFSPANGNFMSDEVPGVTIWNASLGFNLGEEDALRVEFWGSNLTDETYSTKGFINPSVNIRFLNVPRMVGARLRVRF